MYIYIDIHINIYTYIDIELLQIPQNWVLGPLSGTFDMEGHVVNTKKAKRTNSTLISATLLLRLMQVHHVFFLTLRMLFLGFAKTTEG